MPYLCSNSRRTPQRLVGQSSDRLDAGCGPTEMPAGVSVVSIFVWERPHALCSKPAGWSAQCYHHRIQSATRSAIMIVVALVLERVTLGMIEASTTRSPSIPCTRQYWSTTAMASDAGPILHVPDVWCALPAVCNSQASSAASEARACAVGQTGRDNAPESLVAQQPSGQAHRLCQALPVVRVFQL